MIDIVGRCGFKCSICGAYKTNISEFQDQVKVSEGWLRYYGVTIPPEKISCNGCLEELRDETILPEKNCQIRSCVLEKGLANCAHCAEYSCKKLESRMMGCEVVAERFREKISEEEFAKFIVPYDSRKTLGETREELKRTRKKADK